MFRKLIPALVLVLVLAGAFGVQAQDEYTLQIIHSSDNESSFQDPNTLEPKILNYGAIIDGLRQIAPNDGANSIYVTAGDHTLPGPFYEASAEVADFGAPGIADVLFYNAMGLTANGMGNHEFDGGIDDFANMLASADYPFLAVNLDFENVELSEGVPAIEIGEDGQSIQDLAGQVAKSAFVEVGGERIGLIGRAPADFFNVIEDPDTTIPGVDFIGGRNAEDNQPLESAVDQVAEQVALLEAQGLNKIVLLDHAQDFTGDPLTPESLSGIDVIVSAGSTGFFAGTEANGPFNLLREGESATADYPIVQEDADGNTVLVVNTEQLYRYVGHLLVTFDGDGVITGFDADQSGQIASTEEAIAALSELTGTELAPSEEVQVVYDALVGTDLIQEQFTVIGTTTTALNGLRADVRGRETNLGRLAAESSLWFANETVEGGADIALKNGGGIRANILGPNVTVLTVGTALAFNNNMVVVEITADELLATAENAVSRVPAADGRFPQIAGMYLEYDASVEGVSDATSLEETTRVVTLIVTRMDGTEDVVVAEGEPQGDMSRTFRLVTNSFLLTGGDGYQALAAASEARGSEDPEVGERQILIDYITEVLGGEVDLADPTDDPNVVRLDEGE
ncbi:MAG: bifunctional metallophosphatase/5'-nucleotidase [Chloroflexota bacterium]